MILSFLALFLSVIISSQSLVLVVQDNIKISNIGKRMWLKQAALNLRQLALSGCSLDVIKKQIEQSCTHMANVWGHSLNCRAVCVKPNEIQWEVLMLEHHHNPIKWHNRVVLADLK